jgi:hypothetical protein
MANRKLLWEWKAYDLEVYEEDGSYIIFDTLTDCDIKKFKTEAEADAFGEGVFFIQESAQAP